MSEYTPSEGELIEQYARMEPPRQTTVTQRVSEAERGIAKIKAEARVAAWREVSEFFRSQVTDDSTIRHACDLAATATYFRADQIEKEARDEH